MKKLPIALWIISRTALVLGAVGIFRLHIFPATVLYTQRMEGWTGGPLFGAGISGFGGVSPNYPSINEFSMSWENAISAAFLVITSLLREGLSVAIMLLPIFVVMALLIYWKPTERASLALVSIACLLFGLSTSHLEQVGVSMLISPLLFACAIVPVVYTLRQFHYQFSKKAFVRHFVLPTLAGFTATTVVWSVQADGISVSYELARDVARRHLSTPIYVKRDGNSVSASSTPFPSGSLRPAVLPVSTLRQNVTSTFPENFGPIGTSGIPKVLTDAELIKSAGSPLGMILTRAAKSYDSKHFRLDVIGTLQSGTRQQIMAALRESMEASITSMGAEITGKSLSGGTDSLNNFAYDYRWKENDGMVIVYSSATGNGEIQLNVFGYELRG